MKCWENLDGVSESVGTDLMVSGNVWGETWRCQEKCGRDLMVSGKMCGESLWCQVKCGERIDGVRKSVGRDLMVGDSISNRQDKSVASQILFFH